MNPRILEIIQDHALLNANDLEILKKEISDKPYIQNIRALYVLGMHRFQPENYQEVLSTTAAYTTDKKILYQLINGKIFDSTPKEYPLNNQHNSEQAVENSVTVIPIPEEKHDEIQRVEESAENAQVTIELNTNNDSLPENEVITDQQSKIEVDNSPNKIQEIEIVEKFETESNTTTQEAYADENFSELIGENAIEPKITEKVVEDDQYDVENQEVEQIVDAEKDSTENEFKAAEEEHSAEVSFSGIEAFMPEIQIKPTHNEAALQAPVSVAKSEKREEEMKRLIEEVEMKMKAKKSLPSQETSVTEEQEITNNQDLNFEQVQEFNVQTETISKEKESTKEINHKNENPENDSEIGVLNVSFFSPEISVIEPESAEETVFTEQKNNDSDSNIPQFINTWQSWLKIDRNQQKFMAQQHQPVSIHEIKAAAIDKFIEQEPKISQLKQDQNYVVKEKKNDISHLMTETLAKLYVAQKLYSKAINAYEILAQKHPEKESYFLEKIEEIKNFKNNH